MSSYSVASGTTNASGQSLAFAHGLSVTPDIVLVESSNTSASSTSATNITATTVDVYTGNNNQPFKTLAIKVS